MAAALNANRQALAGCVGPHDFQEVKSGWGTYRCTICGGEVDTISYAWYVRGLKHGSKTQPQ
jgi:hypothetical protein